MQQQVTTVHTDKFKAIGPYSAGKIVASTANLVYLSGQLGIIPEVITKNLCIPNVKQIFALKKIFKPRKISLFISGGNFQSLFYKDRFFILKKIIQISVLQLLIVA